MGDLLERVRRLVALTGDPGAAEHEARTAAVKACRLIRSCHLRIVSVDAAASVRVTVDVGGPRDGAPVDIAGWPRCGASGLSVDPSIGRRDPLERSGPVHDGRCVNERLMEFSRRGARATADARNRRARERRRGRRASG
jgi:hypothetical protein